MRELEYNGTRIVNATERYVLEVPEGEFPEKLRNQLIWKTRYRDFYKDE